MKPSSPYSASKAALTQLARVVARLREAHPVDDVVEPELEDPEEVLAGHAGAGLRGLEKSP